jgi:hypothetical protein
LHHPRRLLLAFFAVTTPFACDADPASEGDPGEREPSEAIDLVDPNAWMVTPAEADPLAGHRPFVVECPTTAHELEFGVLEVDTGQCNYLSMSQPLLRPIARGDPLRVTVWWQALVAEAPAEGHLALLVGDDLLWETHVSIPGAAELRQIDFVSPIAAEADSTLTFHLHNHGYNSWTLGGLELLGTK